MLRERALLLNEANVIGADQEVVMANTFHVSLHVEDVAVAVERYKKLLGIEPAKVRPGYAKFEVADPPVILSLNVGGKPGSVSHLGIRYPGTGEVASGLVGAKGAALEPFQEKGVTCCYAKADKYWVRDADGMAWEMYTLLEDVEAPTAADPSLRDFLEASRAKSGAPGCCDGAS